LISILAGAIVLIILLLLIPIRPSTWQQPPLVKDTVVADDISELLAYQDSLEQRPADTLPSVVVDSNLAMDSSQVVIVPTVDTNTTQEAVVPPSPTNQPPSPTQETPEPTPPMKAEIPWGLLLKMLLIFVSAIGVAWLLYRWLTHRQKQKYWLTYATEFKEIPTLGEDYRMDFKLPQITEEIEKKAPDKENTIIDPSLLRTMEEATTDEKPEKEQPQKEAVNGPQQKMTIKKLKTRLTKQKQASPPSEESISWVKTYFLPTLVRPFLMVWGMLQGLYKMYHFFFAKGRYDKKIDFVWNDAVSILVWLAFIPVWNVFLAAQPLSTGSFILLGIGLWVLPTLLRQHWSLGLLGVLLLIGEGVSVLIHYLLIMAAAAPAPAVSSDFWYWVAGIAAGLLLVVGYFTNRLPKFINLNNLFTLIIGALLLYPYWTYDFLFIIEEKGYNDLIVRLVSLWFIHSIISSLLASPKQKQKKKQATPTPSTTTQSTSPKTSTKSTQDLAAVDLDKLFQQKEWWKKIDPLRIGEINMSDQQLHEESEFIIGYLADFKLTQHLYLNNNTFKEVPYDLTILSKLQTLDLSNNEIKKIEPDLRYNKELQFLYLNNNDISTLPAELGELTQLKILELKGNPLSLEEREKLQQLLPDTEIVLDEEIYTSDAPASPPSNEAILQSVLGDRLNHPETVKYIYDLRGKELTDLPYDLMVKFQKLQTLSVGDNQLKKIPKVLFDLPHLNDLNISYNAIDVLPSTIEKWTALQTLDLSSNNIQRLPPEFAQLSALEKLSLSNNKLKTFPTVLLKLPLLKELSLYGTPLNQLPAEIVQLQQLEQVNFGFTDLTAFPKELLEIKSLICIELAGNDIESIPEELIGMPNLRTLNLGQNPDLRITPQFFEKAKGLRTLMLSGAKKVLKDLNFEKLQHLEELWLSYNEWTTIPKGIYTLKNLRVLSLAGNEISEVDPAIAEMENLTTLFLSRNNLQKLPTSIQKLKKLRNLYIRDNNFSDDAIQFLQNSLPQTKVFL